MRPMTLKLAFSTALLLLLTAPAAAETPTSGTVTGEMRLGDQVIPLTHVYVMEPFVLPDAPPDPEVARRLIVILSDRPYPGDLPPVELTLMSSARQLPFNGMALEIDRATGQVLFAQPSLMPTAIPTFFPPRFSSTSTDEFRIAGSLASAHIAASHDPLPRAFPINAPVTVMRGTSYSTYGKTTPALFTPRGTEGFDARFTAHVLPAPRLQRTLIGHQARTSTIATAYAAIQAKHRQPLLSNFERLKAQMDPVMQLAHRGEPVVPGFASESPTAELPRPERLEKILIYERRAVLRFRRQSFDQDLVRTTKTGSPLANSSVFSVTRRDSTAVVDVDNVFARITVIRPKTPEQTVKPWTYFGQSTLPIAGLEQAVDIHMILDDGQWRLARN